MTEPAGDGPLRLAIYVDAEEVGGAETSLATLVAALGPAVAVTVIAHDERVAAFVVGASSARAVVMRPVRTRRDLWGFVRIARAVAHSRPSVLHANLRQPWLGQYGIAAAVLLRVPVVATVHTGIGPARPSQRRLVVGLARRVGVFTAPSRSLAVELDGLLGLPPGRTRVVPNGVPPVATSGAAPRPGAAGASGPTRLAVIGRLAPEKGVDLAVEALVELPGCQLTVVGDGPERSQLELLAQRLGVADRVTFTGWLVSPWATIAPPDVLLVPSRSESFGLVAVEAMRAGVPVVATTVGGIPEVVGGGEAGILVAPGDPHALAVGVRELLADDARRARLVAAGQRAAEAFDPAAVAATFTGLYRAVRR